MIGRESLAEKMDGTEKGGGDASLTSMGDGLDRCCVSRERIIVARLRVGEVAGTYPPSDAESEEKEECWGRGIFGRDGASDDVSVMKATATGVIDANRMMTMMMAVDKSGANVRLLLVGASAVGISVANYWANNRVSTLPSMSTL